LQATITELHDRLGRREISAGELLDQQLARIEEQEPRVHAYLRLTGALAREQAQAADRLFRDGEQASPLTGIPAAVKDVLSVQGVETTAGSKILAGYRPPFDATAVARLKAAGMVLLGITNCDEFAMGSSTENSGYFVTRNPHDLQRADPAGAAPRPWPPARPSTRWAPTLAAPSGSRPLSAVWWE